MEALFGDFSGSGRGARPAVTGASRHVCLLIADPDPGMLARLPMSRRYVAPANPKDFTMAMEDKPQGPASYFPSIEKKYGRPIGHWLALVEQARGMKHMEIVAWLKQDHGLGHGHANAIVAHVLSVRKGQAS